MSCLVVWYQHVGRVLTNTEFFFCKGSSLGLVSIFYTPLFQENFDLKKLPFGISAMLIKKLFIIIIFFQYSLVLIMRTKQIFL